MTLNPLYGSVNANKAFISSQYGDKLYHSGGYAMENVPLINCRDLSFSLQLSKNRIDQAKKTLGQGVVQRVLCFALYLLGVNRSAIAKLLSIPLETSKSIIKAVTRDGIGAFEDRRRRVSTFLPKVQPEAVPITLKKEEDHVVVDLGDRYLKLPRQDSLQVKIVLLTMLNNHLLRKRSVAEALELTPSHTTTLARRLSKQGACSLVDRRQGQKQEYRVPAPIKAELVQQFAVDIITSGQTSGNKISTELKERCNISVPPRTVRHHLAQMGLREIKQSLPQLLAGAKKNSKN